MFASLSENQSLQFKHHKTFSTLIAYSFTITPHKNPRCRLGHVSEVHAPSSLTLNHLSAG